MANRESIPPPPYSETDTVSNSNIVLTPATSQADNFSVAGQGYPSTTSSNESIKIYTPGASPSPSEYQPSGQDNNHSISDGFTSAFVYFESRPLHTPISREPLKNYTISINPTTVPNDLPYPEDLVARDITHQDWATFVNYLLPAHTIISNHDVADRKIRAEFLDEEMEDLSVNEKSSKIIDPVLAQLEPLRSPESSVSPNSTTISLTIEEWNVSFFGPRGVRIILHQNQNRDQSPGEQTTSLRDMPGTWIPYDHELLPQQPESSGSSTKAKPTRRGMLSGFLPGVVEANSKGFRMGPIVADSEGFRIGRGLVADNNGFKIGNMLIADNKGFRLGGSRGFAADSNGVTIGSRSFGRRESHDEQSRARGARRGRRQCHPESQNINRGRSLSTSSSSSHASSSDSVSSVGSLPEYEDLREQQLPIARMAIKNWLDHPDIPITKETVLGIKQEIRESKSGDVEQRQEDMAALKKEVKEMMRTFKERTRSEKRQRRARKREKRAARKAAKRERRNAKREERRTRREERREENISSLQQHPPTGVPGPNHGISMPILPSNIPVPSIMRGFPFARTAFTPSTMKDPHSFHTPPPPGFSALHGAWPFTQGRPYAPGNISVPNFNFQDPTPVLRSAEQIQEQLMEIEKLADEREAMAVELYISGSVESIEDAERKRIINEATALEEEASVYRREADRLRSEGQHLDSELARELEESDNVHVEHGGQVSGVIRQ